MKKTIDKIFERVFFLIIFLGFVVIYFKNYDFKQLIYSGFICVFLLLVEISDRIKKLKD